MGHSSSDEFESVKEMLERPFPKKVVVASSYSMPIFAGGSCWWNIVDASGTGEVVASVVFGQADLNHARYKEYMGAILARAQRVADLINAGLSASEQT